MTKASDNVFPKLIGAEGAAPGTPAAATAILYVKADGLWYSKDDAGAETLVSGGSGIPATLLDVKGDLIVASAADTAARLAAAANGAALVTASGESTGLKWRLNNDGASVAPTVNEDSGDGYSIGSRWIDTTADKEYIATDVTVGAAVWKETTAAGGGGGVAYGQTNSYPTTFSGDTIDGSSATPFADVSAFSTKEVLNGRILHLKTLGASKDHRVRVTLGTTKAGAFDVATCIAFNGYYWSAGAGDVYLEVRGSTSADAQLFIFRIIPVVLRADVTTPIALFDAVRPGGSTISAVDATGEPKVTVGTGITLRAVRDGSNVITFYYGIGSAPMALVQFNNGPTHDDVPYSVTVSGTLARIEYSIHTPSGPGATAQWDAYIDWLASI